MGVGRSWLLGVVVFLLAVSAASAAVRYDPRLRFRTIRTAHFDIHYHQGEEALAARLADIAESTRAKMQRELGVPPGRVQVILVNQSDFANGWATPVPYDAIEVTALPPGPQSFVGNTTDWLELVFTHEYTHIAHLDRTRGIMRAFRTVLGRNPVAFPNVFLPEWQVEGIATYEESRVTGEGRVPARDFRNIVDVAARQGRFEPRDRVSGGLDDWPDGNGWYAYGAYFHEFLERRYGAERIAALADVTAGRVPFFGAGAFSRVFGKSIDTLWHEFEQSREDTPKRASETDRQALRVTHHGFSVGALRLAPDGTIYYSLSDADNFPALMAIAPGGTPRRIAWRYGGNATAVAGDWVVFDQVRFVRSVALYSDLYAVPRRGGRVRRLTDARRLGDPDLSPDGRTVVSTVEDDGRHALATLTFDPRGPRRAPSILVDDPASDYASPRWSPDGRSITALRRRAGAFELVVIDATSRDLRVLVTRTHGRMIAPSWTGDGRSVLVSIDEPDRGVNVFAVDVADGTLHRVTDSVTGAQLPQLSPDGRTLYYVGYTADGFDVFSVPFRLSAEAIDASVAQPFRAARDTSRAESLPRGSRPYNPVRTLLPTYWTPIVASSAGEVTVGAATAMSDALGRHAYAADAAWSVNRARPDWHASYAYDRWRPTLFLLYSDETDPIAGGEFRSRQFEAGAQLPFRHVRYAETFLAAFDAENDAVSCDAGCGTRVTTAARRSVRGGWMHDSRRAFGYSISAEEGALLEVSAEESRASEADDVTAGAGIVDLRAYQRVRGHAVFALRAATAIAWGEPTARRVFSAAGEGPAEATFDFGRNAIGLLRGFVPDDVVATRAAVVNADLRFPLVRPERGAGSWPLFVRALHAAAFLDAGDAWDTSPDFSHARLSFGGEVSFDTVLGFSVPVTFVAGAAWTRDPTRAIRYGGAIFGRIGHAF